MKKFRFMLVSILTVSLFAVFQTGCATRFAIITKTGCSHPENQRRVWPEEMINSYFIHPCFQYYIDGIILNPLHWHRADHHKCGLCGQKFCDSFGRRKWLNKVIKK